MQEQFDLFTARAARNLGIERATNKDPEWQVVGLTRIKSLPSGYEGIAEEICAACCLEPAPTPGAVGAMIRCALKLGLLVRTGQMRQPTCVKSHARATYIWRRP